MIGRYKRESLEVIQLLPLSFQPPLLQGHQYLEASIRNLQVESRQGRRFNSSHIRFGGLLRYYLNLSLGAPGDGYVCRRKQKPGLVQ
jgi:hypothetical protein